MRITAFGFGGLLFWALISWENLTAATPGITLDGSSPTGKNGGLIAPQAPETMPKSNVPPQTATRKPKLSTPPELLPLANGDLELSSGWELVEAPQVSASVEEISRPQFDTTKWYDATVPGTVLTTLVDQGVYPDPYYGLNNLAIPESLNRQDYWYRQSFTAPASYLGKHVSLTFHGINYHAQVWLNGKACGEITGAFIRGIFDITDKIRAGEPNVLLVKISPPPHPGIPHEQSVVAGTGPNGGALCQDGPTFFATEGWDWIPGIRDRDTGIWQKVVVHATGSISLSDPQVVTSLPLPRTDVASLSIAIKVQNLTDSPQTGLVKGVIENIIFEQPVTLAPNETKVVSFTPADFPVLTVAHPRLWWPNGYGKPELYSLHLAIEDSAHAVSDATDVRFGLRTIECDRTPQLTVRVNGRRIMCLGGSWGMDDAMKRVSRARLEPCLRMHRDANLNMIRTWCGQSIEEDLYDLCDEYGIMVWSELWMSSRNYNLAPNDEALFLANARDTMLRFRNHPSNALWGGRNEGAPPPSLDAGLAKLEAELDPTRSYQSSSRGFGAEDKTGPWKYLDPKWYFTWPAGFRTELGMPSIPSVEALRTMIPEADLWPMGDTWAYHDLARGAQDGPGWTKTVEKEFGPATDLPDFCRKSELLAYSGYRSMLEGWESKMFQPSTGLLLWMTHPAWPSTVWQLYSWDREPTAALFGAEKACEPLHILLNQADFTVMVVNRTDHDLQGASATAEVYDVDAHEVKSAQAAVTCAVDAVDTLFPIDWPKDDGIYFVKLELHDASGTILSKNFYWHAAQETDLQKLHDLKKATLSVQSSTRDHQGEVEVTATLKNSGTVLALLPRVSLREEKTGKRILPAYYSDNDVSLLPGESCVLKISCADSLAGNGLQLHVDGFNLDPQIYSCPRPAQAATPDPTASNPVPAR